MFIGRKLGMTRIFSEEGKSLPVTVIKASPCFILDRRTEERDGYTAYVMGFGEKKEKRVKKPVLGLCKKAGVPPVEVIREFRAKDTSAFGVGEKVPVSVLQKGDRIDVVGWSKGRGFQGVVKRWGFAGGPGSHGSRFGRAPGSAGAGTYPGRVLKGKKFPGRMGNDRVTIKNLEIVSLDEENGLIVVKGAVPGFKNGLLLIKVSSDIDISARKELAREKPKKEEEKAQEEVTEEKVEERTEEKVETKVAKKEKEAKQTEDKSKKEKAEVKEDKKEEKAKDKPEKAKTEEVKEKVEEKTEEKAEEKREEEKEIEDSIEKAAEGAEDSIEKKAEAKIEEKTEEAAEKAEEKKEEVKNEDDKEEKAEKKDKGKEKGDS